MTTTSAPSLPSTPPPGTSPLERHARRLFAAGRRMFSQAEWQAAVRLFELVLKVNPDHLLARRYLGEALLELGEVKPALRHLHRVYREDPAAGRQVFRRALKSLALQTPPPQAQDAPHRTPPFAEAETAPAQGDSPPQTGRPPQGPFPVAPANAASLREVTTLGRGRIVAFTHLPDGETLAVASAIGVYLYDVHTLAVRRFLPAASWVWSVAASPDGALLAAGLEDGRVLLWLLAEADAPLELPAHNQAVRVLTFSPDGALLASGSREGVARLWQVDSRTLLRSIKSGAGEIRALTFSADGAYLALACESRHIQVRRVRDGALMHTLRGHHQAVRSVAFTSDGRLIAAGGEDGRINFWRMGEERPFKTIKDFMGIINRIAFSPDNRLLASASWDGSVRLWRPGDGSIRQRLEEQRNPISDCQFSPDGSLLTTLTINEEIVRMWSVHSGELLKSLAHINALLAVAASPRQDYLAAGTSDGRVLVWAWPPRTGEPDVTLAGHQAAVRSVAFAPSGEYLASGGDDSYLMVWKLSHSAARRLNLPRSSGSVNRLLFTPDERWLFAATESGRIYCWDARDLWETAMLPVVPTVWAQHTYSVEDLACSANGAWLADGTDGGRGHLWQAASSAMLNEYTGEMRAVRSVALAPEGGLLAFGATDGRIHLWQALEGLALRQIAAHEGPVRTLAFSPDGRLLASAGVDGRIRLWEAETGRALCMLQGHTRQIWQVSFAPDGIHLLSAGGDGTLRIWAPSA